LAAAAVRSLVEGSEGRALDGCIVRGGSFELPGGGLNALAEAYRFVGEAIGATLNEPSVTASDVDVTALSDAPRRADDAEREGVTEAALDSLQASLAPRERALMRELRKTPTTLAAAAKRLRIAPSTARVTFSRIKRKARRHK